MASVVASMVDVPKPVFLKDILASPSASGKTIASDGHLFVGTGGAPLRSSDDDVKDSTGVKGSTGVKDSTSKDTAADPRRERDIPIPKLFATRDVLDQFPEAAMRDLLLALVEDGGAASSMTGFSPRDRFWISKDDAYAVQLKMAMPGLGREHVKMRAEKDTLVIKGDAGDKDSEGDDDKGSPWYTYCIGISSQAFKMDQIKAEMKNGVLMVTLPKIKDEERKDVFEIEVE